MKLFLRKLFYSGNTNVAHNIKNINKQAVEKHIEIFATFSFTMRLHINFNGNVIIIYYKN